MRAKSLLLSVGFTFLCLNIVYPIFGQKNLYNAEVTHYGIEEGISSRTINDLHQDARGFIWLATKYGLNRLDGKHFQWFNLNFGLFLMAA